MNKVAFFIAAFVLTSLTSCEYVYYERGSGDMITKNYDLESYNEVELVGDYEVVLIQSDQERLEIEADDNLMDDIEVDVFGKTLRVESRRIRSRKGIRLEIYYKEIEGLHAGGAMDLTSRNPIRAKFFDLGLSGAGAVRLEFEGEKLELQVSGAGDVELSGNTRDLEVRMSGAGGLDAFDLRAEYARVRISGVGGAEVYVTKELDANISGMGDITYRGNPTVVDKDVSGLGTIGQDRNYSDDQ